MIYRLDDFTENSINPITNQPYDDSWVIWVLTDSKEYKMMVGGFTACAYTIKFSFYLKSAEEKYKGHSFDEPLLREDEQEYTVHSPSLENWQLIQKCGCLKSWIILKAEGVVTEEKPIGNALGDPEDFSNYIMFGKNVAGELVVNSKQQGKIIMEKNAEYLTGARLYLDIKKIVADGMPHQQMKL